MGSLAASKAIDVRSGMNQPRDHKSEDVTIVVILNNHCVQTHSSIIEQYSLP